MLNERQLHAWQALNFGPAWLPRQALNLADGLVSDSGTQAPSQADQLTIESARSTDAAQSPGNRSVGLVPVDAWLDLRQRVESCTACPLGRSRQRAVLGSGPVSAPWMLVGEAPGAEEDRTGEPFVGRAGELLDSILSAVGLDRRNEVYVANVIKCRPPDNRNPEPDEIGRCEPYLNQQVKLVKPRLLVLMGRFAAQTLLGTEAAIASLRGRVHEVKIGGELLPAVVTYHPAYLLRNPADKVKAWSDWCLARRVMADLGAKAA
jgi:uracil-DNA glycosylase family 4